MSSEFEIIRDLSNSPLGVTIKITITENTAPNQKQVERT